MKLKSNQKFRNKINAKEKIFTIEAVYIISLDELVLYVIKKGENDSLLFDMLNKKPDVVNIKMKKIIKEVLSKNKSEVMFKELKFDYNDSESFLMGIAYFKATLKGTKRELKKIAGTDKLFFYEWEENNKTPDSAND